ncbi:MAG: hypothetical protein HY292_05475 [Planctomycetes bacterium]|nr:hypothetical protein [Planctomycetota bacterium]
MQEVRTDVDPIGRDYVLVVLELEFTAPPIAQIRVEALGGLVELADPSVAITPFGATLQTGATLPTDDAIVEEFDDVRRLDRSSTALWNVATSGTLRSGTGFGGDGIDGSFPPPGGGTSFVLDTTANDGTFQFTSFTIPSGATVTAAGPFPLRILSIGDVTIAGALHADGQVGEAGLGNDDTPRLGGAGGPGGGKGGRTSPPADPSGCSAQFPCWSGAGDSPGGGSGGRRANNANGISGGGGAGSYGTVGAPGTAGGVPASPGPTYGNPEIEPFAGGSGGGGGGDKPGNAQYPHDSTGGAGGGGGGAVLIQSDGTVNVTGALTANGGTGGSGFSSPGVAPPPSAAGGGGSGGAIKVQARQIATISTLVSAIGGSGGLAAPLEGRGGSGGSGRIRLESESGSLSIGAVVPAPSIASLDPRFRTTTSFAQSRWIDTNAPSAHFAFDGSDPITGLARLDPNGVALPGVTDVAFIGPVDPRTTVRFLFAGAQAKPTNPNEADPATDTGFVTDVRAIDGHAFVRFRIVFEATAPLVSLPEVVVDRLRIRFSYP